MLNTSRIILETGKWYAKLLYGTNNIDNHLDATVMVY